MAEELVPRDEASAALQARRELGPEYEDELVEAFARRIEQRVASTPAPARDRSHETGIAIVSLLAAIPLIAIAGNFGGLAGIVAVCIALVLVNVVTRR